MGKRSMTIFGTRPDETLIASCSDEPSSFCDKSFVGDAPSELKTPVVAATFLAIL